MVLREEYLAWLSGYEELIPELFDNRLRIEKMSERQLRQVILGTLQAEEFGIDLREETKLTNQIILNIRGERREVDLTELQVYLDHLYRQARVENGHRIFDSQLARDAGEMTNVLSMFLEEQLGKLEKKLKTTFQINNPHGIPLEILFTLVTDEMTKRSMDRQMMLRHLSQLPEERRIGPEVLDFCLEEFDRLRLLNLAD